MPTSNNVKNLNTLNTLGFEFVLSRSPNLIWFIQSVNIPGVTIGDSSRNYSTGKASIPGDDLEYNELSITFIIDESLNGWREIYNWIRGLAPTSIGKNDMETDTSNQYKSLMDSNHGILSDATLILHTNLSNPNIKFEFKDVYPLSLGDMEMNVSGTSVDAITTTVEFRYTRYDISVIESMESQAVEGNTL